MAAGICTDDAYSYKDSTPPKSFPHLPADGSIRAWRADSASRRRETLNRLRGRDDVVETTRGLSRVERRAVDDVR